ncbi:MAG: amidase [Pseudonocardia sp.]|uniref:amidase n=1 Tax=unclassified Pseudonocardia TaxID=2619320 RepID=UPI00086E1AF0|nr:MULTISPECIES: amidase family protein [unclassified Pseudonocardia]MBN9112531.1 amidase [Pseudonocardia sp.]ODU24603.1 MAG: amidase [Pseudonocardia sp. SCN 72-51]ODV07075.1 MAG: amidase [Pseudonocardia sp. SCN 73-27]
MELSEYADLDATALADLIRTGQVHPDEVARTAIAALQAVQPKVNGLVDGPFERPLDHAADGPFAGVPFAIKDLITHAAGVPTRSGTRLLGPGVPMPEDTLLMARFRRAGLATLGLTATPELGFNANTEAVATGSVRNPWDLDRSPGGSSGGSAALVAARALPVAHGNDGGGSIRIPAAACGLVGLKPSQGRVSPGPDYADPLLGLGIEFALTRTVRDCAGLLDAVHGHEPGDRYLLPDPVRSYADEVAAGSRRLRIALHTEPFSGNGSVDPRCVAAVESVGRTLEGLGHVVERAAPVLDAAAFDDANLVAWCSFLADGIDTICAALGIEAAPDSLEATTRACAELGRTMSAGDLYAAERVFNTARRAVATFHQSWDLVLTPTMNVPNTAAGYLNADDASLDARGWYDHIFSTAGFTALSNVTGNPAISLPLGSTEEGWPIGVQFVAPYAGEATLIAIAADLERALPWADRRPPVVAG